MKRFGATPENMGSMDGTAVFMNRIHLMVVIVKAALKGYPVGKHRKKAAMENANEVYKLIDTVDLAELNYDISSHLFRQRIKLLCVMCSAIVSDGYPLGVHRRQAILDNVRMVIEYAFPNQNMELFTSVLKVA